MKREPKVYVIDLDPMITMESRTEGIRFERHKEESLISSQFFEELKEEQNLTISDVFIQ